MSVGNVKCDNDATRQPKSNQNESRKFNRLLPSDPKYKEANLLDYFRLRLETIFFSGIMFLLLFDFTP